MANSKRYYKLKKNDTLDLLARKFKYKGWKQIWQANQNAALRKKRGKPENLQVGDIVYLPVTDAERKRVEKSILELNTMRDDLLTLRNDFEADIKRLEHNCKNLTRIIGETKRATAAMIAEIKAAKKEVKKVANAVDLAATLINLGRALGKLAYTGFKASKASGEALEKINDQLTKDVKKKIRDGHIDAARKSMVLLKDTSLEPVWIVCDSFNKMVSPSFWAMTFAQIWDGKSWSEAVTYDIDADCARKIRKLERDRDTNVRNISAQIARQKGTIKTLQAAIKQIDRRIGHTERTAVQLMESIE